jgi:hypothetical protein
MADVPRALAALPMGILTIQEGYNVAKSTTDVAVASSSQFEAGAPQIEITPEMIEAGATVVWQSPIECPTEQDVHLMVKRILRVMTQARR